MATLLGWKDILRPIRDGYRHLFPAPDTGPTPEERQKQREADRFKGFTYFDTFDQLEAWTEADSDPYQQANTPLLKRPINGANDDLGRTEVLLVHDYAGNYHDYENSKRIDVLQESYSCEYLQFVDTFIYFSHKLACVPPPSWINTLHRNGVSALGTLLFEPQTEGLHRLLEYTDDGSGKNFPAAKILARIAKHYGFEGWLVNIEKPFPRGQWEPEILTEFLHQLREELGEGLRVIWYDALTISNKVSYQNTLNEANHPFATACGSLLTNYCWTENHARKALRNATPGESYLKPSQVFFGVDVWAQNTSKLSQPRTTYPEFGGGGTNTGIALAKLASLGLSAGIFAPAWSFEHFPENGRIAEKAMWEGIDLLDGTTCDCGDCLVRHRPNKELPIVKYAKLFSAGSDSFFYTDFSRAFAKHDPEHPGLFINGQIYAQLGAQSVLPLPCFQQDNNQKLTLVSRLETFEKHTRLVIEARRRDSDEDIEDTYLLPLYKLNMPANGSLQLTSSLRIIANIGKNAEICLYARTDTGKQIWSLQTDKPVQSLQATIGTTTSNDRIRELGVLLRGSPCLQLLQMPLLEVRQIRIAQQLASQARNSWIINNLYMERRHQRNLVLGWTCKNGSSSTSMGETGLPYSDTTGPFAYFSVRVDGLDLGRAYALEIVMPIAISEQEPVEGYDIEIEGFGFDGLSLAKGVGTVRKVSDGTA